MRTERGRGMKGQVVVTVSDCDSTDVIMVHRAGKLGLAFRSPVRPVFTDAPQPGGQAKVAPQGLRRTT